MATDSIKIVIHPSGSDSDDLTIADAMQQVLDYLSLLKKAEPTDERDDAQVVWRLKSASTNSPFTVEAEPSSSVPELSMEHRGITAGSLLFDGIEGLLKADSQPDWMDLEAEKTFQRILDRNLNGIGRTDFIAPGHDAPVIIDSRSARRASNFLQLLAAQREADAVDWTRKERGSVEGNVVSLTSHYGHPAIVIKARLSGREVKCVLTTGAERIGREHRWDEVWAGRRVLVSGLCHYDKSGDIVRIDVSDVEEIASRHVSIHEFRDPNFSDGLSPSEHIDQIWGDEQ